MSSDDEDWFEQALSEEEAESETAEGEAEEGETAEGEAEEGEGPAEPDVEEAGEEGAGTPDVEGVEGEGGEGAPFGDDFATAFQNAPQPDVGDEGGGGAGQGEGPGAAGGFGEADGFGEAGGGAGSFGGFGEAGGGGAGGFGGEAEPFDEEAEFESEIDRIEVGIEGLDEMILGGVPRRSLMTVIGSAGTGKTTVGLQFLEHGLAAGNRAVYITLEESRQHIIETADEKGLGFSEYVEEEQLAVVDFDPIQMANSLSSVSSELPSLVEEFDATRLVLDSVSLLEMMYDDPARRRSEVFEFARSLKEAGVTTMVTSEASQESAFASRYGIIEYLADAVLVLQYVRPSDFRETRLAVEIQKIRNANHSRKTKPYEITDEGISVYRQANIF
ncbi:MAG: KaiC domain-containing protein [Haloferacaceae archaeon]